MLAGRVVLKNAIRADSAVVLCSLRAGALLCVCRSGGRSGSRSGGRGAPGPQRGGAGGGTRAAPPPDLSAMRLLPVWTQPLPLVPLVRFPHGIYTGCMGYVSLGPEAGDSHGRLLKTQKRVQRPEAVEPLRPKDGAVQRYSLRRRMDPPEVRRVMRGPPPLIEPLRLFLSSVPCDTGKSVETRPPDVRASTCKPISAARETSTLPPEVLARTSPSTSPMRMEPPKWTPTPYRSSFLERWTHPKFCPRPVLRCGQSSDCRPKSGPRRGPEDRLPQCHRRRCSVPNRAGAAP